MASPQASSKPVSAFFEPGPPPPPVPVLSSHVDLLSKGTVILCSREDLLFLLAGSTPSRAEHAHRHTPVATRASTPHPPVIEAPRSPSTAGEDEDDTMSDAALSESSLTSLESTGNKIPKPDGEPGRPGRGGYNLETQLAWDSTTFLRLKKFVHRSIKRHLDTTKCKSRQSNDAIRLVIQEASKGFPDLEDYALYWPVHDLIQMRLKYTSGRARLSQRMATGDGKGKKRSVA